MIRALLILLTLASALPAEALDCYYRLTSSDAVGKRYQKIATTGTHTLSSVRVFLTDSPTANPSQLRAFREIPIFDVEHQLRMPADTIVEPTRRTLLQELAGHRIPARPRVARPIEAMKNSHGHWFRDSKNHAYDLDFNDSCQNCIILGRYFIDRYDAGNLLWGAAMRWLRFGYLDVKVGSELNEMFGSIRGNKFNWAGDTAADQEAIRLGFFRLAPALFRGLDPKLSIRENLDASSE